LSQPPVPSPQPHGLAPGQAIVRVDRRYYRPAEVDTLLGDPSKAKEKLGWEPKVTFRELVSEMVRADLEAARRDELVKNMAIRRLIITSKSSNL